MELIIKNLSKSFKDKQVLDSVSMTFEQGKIYSVIGRNGSGKTTLFNCLNGDLKYESGEVYLKEGETMRELEFEDIALVSDTPLLPDFLTGFEFIHFFAKLHHKTDLSTKEWLDLVRIDPPDHFKLIKSYSFGMKNKLQLLCCLIRRPKIILLDEPLSSFDIVVSHEIKELLLRMRKDHIIIMSTHIMQLAQDVSDDIVLLHHKKLREMPMDSENREEFEETIMAALQEKELKEELNA